MKHASAVAWAVMENHGFEQVKDLSSHQRLIAKGAVFCNYSATTHPSGPNYRSLACGHTLTSAEEYGQPAPSIASSVNTTILYLSDIAARHNPYKDTCASNLQEIHWSSVAPVASMYITAELDTLKPEHLYLGWGDADNAHSGPLDVADKNLNTLLDALDASTWFNNAVNGLYPVFMFVWDEDLSQPTENHVFCAMYGRGVKPGFYNGACCHFNFNRTMTTIYDLQPLGLTGTMFPMLEPFTV